MVPEQVGRTPRGVRDWLRGKAIVREMKKQSLSGKRGPNSGDLRSVDPSNAEARIKAEAAAATSTRERKRQDQLRALNRRTQSQHAAAASDVAGGDGEQLQMEHEEGEVKSAGGGGNVEASWSLSALGAAEPAEGEDWDSIEEESKDDGSGGAA